MTRRAGPSSRRNPAERAEDYYQQVADALVEQIEKGTAPWTQAWQPGEKAMPANLQTGKAYRGGNSVWLMSVAERRGFTDPRWGTYRQVQELGGQVRQGERGTAILYWKFETRREVTDRAGRPVLDARGKPVYETTPRLTPLVRRYTVFNAEQCDGVPRPERIHGAAWDPHAAAERVLTGSGARLKHSGEDRAFYDLRHDRIVLPHKEQFPERTGYYQAALHELGHWTGHSSRLNRATLLEGIVEGPDSQQYAREELRAEISSMMTGDRLDLGHDPARSASYVGHWIKALRDDPREIYRASRDAQAISDYVLAFDRQREAERPAAPADRPAAPVVPMPPHPPIQEPASGEQYRLFQRGRPAPSLADLARESTRTPSTSRSR